MARISFTFERSETDAPNGFELGDLTVATDAGTVTSKGRNPDAGMMIYISLVDLMSGLSSLLRAERRQYEFVGADSSFSLLFKRSKRGVEITQGKKDSVRLIYASWQLSWRPTRIASGTLIR